MLGDTGAAGANVCHFLKHCITGKGEHQCSEGAASSWVFQCLQFRAGTAEKEQTVLLIPS